MKRPTRIIGGKKTEKRHPGPAPSKDSRRNKQNTRRGRPSLSFNEDPDNLALAVMRVHLAHPNYARMLANATPLGKVRSEDGNEIFAAAFGAITRTRNESQRKPWRVFIKANHVHIVSGDTSSDPNVRIFRDTPEEKSARRLVLKYRSIREGEKKEDRPKLEKAAKLLVAVMVADSEYARHDPLSEQAAFTEEIADSAIDQLIKMGIKEHSLREFVKNLNHARSIGKNALKHWKNKEKPISSWRIKY